MSHYFKEFVILTTESEFSVKEFGVRKELRASLVLGLMQSYYHMSWVRTWSKVEHSPKICPQDFVNYTCFEGTALNDVLNFSKIL